MLTFLEVAIRATFRGITAELVPLPHPTLRWTRNIWLGVLQNMSFSERSFSCPSLVNMLSKSDGLQPKSNGLQPSSSDVDRGLGLGLRPTRDGTTRFGPGTELGSAGSEEVRALDAAG